MKEMTFCVWPTRDWNSFLMNLRIALTKLSEGNVNIRSSELALMHCLHFVKAIFCNGNISLSTTYKESLDHFCQLWVEVLLPKLDDDSVVARMWADQSWLFWCQNFSLTGRKICARNCRCCFWSQPWCHCVFPWTSELVNVPLHLIQLHPSASWFLTFLWLFFVLDLNFWSFKAFLECAKCSLAGRTLKNCLWIP